jgi:SET domain-containing protein
MGQRGFHSNKVRVLPAGVKGRGVFARGPLACGEVIEFAPVLVLERSETPVLLGTALGHHAFDLGRNRVGIGLGYASLYNHTRNPNAEFESSVDGIRIVALRAIRTDEEILLDYRWTDRELADAGIPRDS